MKKTLYISFLILVVAGLLAGFYFRNDILDVFNTATKKVQANLQTVQKTNVAGTVNKIATQVLAPLPLTIGGSANNVVLVKSKIIAQTNIQRFAAAD